MNIPLCLVSMFSICLRKSFMFNELSTLMFVFMSGNHIYSLIYGFYLKSKYKCKVVVTIVTVNYHFINDSCLPKQRRRRQLKYTSLNVAQILYSVTSLSICLIGSSSLYFSLSKDSPKYSLRLANMTPYSQRSNYVVY